MKIDLWKKPKKGAVIIEGFPGFGLVGTIAAEYLIDHLGAEQIGKIWSEKMPSIVAIHQGKVIEPLAIFYDEKNNIILLRAVAPITGMEWELAEEISKFMKDIDAKEMIDIEGVSGSKESAIKETPETFYYSTNDKNKKKFESIGLQPMQEGIVVGVTASLLTKLKGASFVFAESYSELPDSRAAAKIIEVIDKYLGLKIDYKPLLEKAEKFEEKIKGLLMKSAQISKEKEFKEKDNYFG